MGFLALTDAAPFAAAEELGLFVKHGIRVQLTREVGWATIREKIIYGELDAAQCPAPMLWSTALGVDSVPFPVLSALVLSMHGNAITLAERLWDIGVRDVISLREEARRRSGERKLTFGVVFAQSSHHIFLRGWLSAGGIQPDRDVRIVVVPPAQMFRNLAAGTIDGYCAGEPWNTLSVREKIGWCPAWSAGNAFCGVEKVLMVAESFAAQRASEHHALLAALHEACAWCDEPGNREPLARILAGGRYINQSTHVIAPSLLGSFDCGHGRVESIPDFHVFSRGGANVPGHHKAESLQRELVDSGLLKHGLLPAGLAKRLFREDLFHSAIRSPITHELVS